MARKIVQTDALVSLQTQDTSRPYIAAGLSLMVPGLGQVFNRQLGKGLAVFFLSFLVVPYVYGVIDAFLVGRKLRERHFLVSAPSPRLLVAPREIAEDAPRGLSFEQVLLDAARARRGELSVTEGVLATGRSFKEVEAKLDEMCRSGYVDIGNREESGVVVYRFGELA